MHKLPEHIHLVGIGGIGLSAIARVLVARGHRVSGSDLEASERTRELLAMGIDVLIGHRADQIGEADLVVASSAIPQDNVELAAARAVGIPVVDRREFLPALLAGYRCIAVAGTHGKTTTTAMIAYILQRQDYSPSYIVGGIVPQLGGNANAGMGDCFAIEADEYGRMFHGLMPDTAIITNIEMDHPDYYADLEDVRDSFRGFVQRINAGGALIACIDNPGVCALLDGEQDWPIKVWTYGEGQDAQYRISIGEQGALGGRAFTVRESGNEWLTGELSIPGRHNAFNAVAALLAAVRCGADKAKALEALKEFRGVQRRFEIKGERSGVVVIDDYAHHPTELAATISAAKDRYPGRRLWAVFQPHTFSRTAALLPQFCDALEQADRVLVLDIYRARAFEHGDVGGQDIVTRLSRGKGTYLPNKKAAAAHLVERVRDGDLVITLGAGDGYLVGEWLLKALEARE